MYQRIFDNIDSLAEKYTDLLEDICNIESPTSYKAGVDAVVEYIVKAA